jgi:hypothetical protein
VGGLGAIATACLIVAVVLVTGGFANGPARVRPLKAGLDIQHWYAQHGGSRFAQLLDPPPVSLAGSPAHARIGGAAAAAAGALLGAGGPASGLAFDPLVGLWSRPVRRPPPGAPQSSPMWWQSALALRALIRYATVTGGDAATLERVLGTVYGRGIHHLEARWRIDFRDAYLDDTGWWGLAWASAAGYELDVRHDVAAARRYLRLAELIAQYIASAHRRCGAGINFTLHIQPSTITNEEFIALTAELARLRESGRLRDLPRARHWLRASRRVLTWLEHSGLVDMARGTVHFDLDGSCRPQGPGQTYSEAEMAEALTQLGLATGQRAYFAQAQRFLDALRAPRSGFLAGGILQEPCEGTFGQCRLHSYNITAFKGIAVDAVADWTLATGQRRFLGFLHRQAVAVALNASGLSPARACTTPAACELSLYWARWVPAGRDPIPPTPGSQASGLSALTDSLAVDRAFGVQRGDRT